MTDPAADPDHVRRRIEAAGFKLPPDRADEIIAAAPLMAAFARRVRRALAHTDEPAAVVRLERPQR